ncbi:hypothetical protein, partial [Coleofasciculus sp.]|uniref:hypothetical protein n=1 Tax=Coleofasciculus sp. TaxID=3100458 RepID=UPI003A284ECC
PHPAIASLTLTLYCRKPKRNVTDLMLVGNAHPTVSQRFCRSHNAYFSDIQPKSAIAFLPKILTLPSKPGDSGKPVIFGY